MTKHQHGGRREGAGRKTVKPGEPTSPFSMRLSANQRAKLDRLGGGQWLRERIDRARDPGA